MTHFGSSGFSDFIVFVDESGSPTLSAIDPNHPVFVLALCIFNKWEYCDVIQPAIKRLKFEFFGHDMTILHSRDIRKRSGDFSILMNEDRRLEFLAKLESLVAESRFDIIATVIDKREVWRADDAHSDYIYHHALWECVKKLYWYLNRMNALDRLTHIVAESRGRAEDANLLRAFESIPFSIGFDSKEPEVRYHTEHLALLFAEKKINSAGLQLADLVGYPIGRHAISPLQPNRAFDAIKAKIFDEITPFFLP